MTTNIHIENLIIVADGRESKPAPRAQESQRRLSPSAYTGSTDGWGFGKGRTGIRGLQDPSKPLKHELDEGLPAHEVGGESNYRGNTPPTTTVTEPSTDFPLYPPIKNTF